jgi:cell wall-associated NlpC family hydrolase
MKEVFGKELPADPYLIVYRAREISLRDRKSGDLIFIDSRAKGIPSHAGILIDEKRFLHYLKSKGSALISKLDHPFWSKRIICLVRLH